MNLLRRSRRQPSRCTDVLTGWMINGRDGWRCELEDDGHEWHERTSPPLQGRWKRIDGGVHMEILHADASKA